MEERKVAYERAMAASFKADNGKEELQDSVDDLVRRQREEQLKLIFKHKQQEKCTKKKL